MSAPLLQAADLARHYRLRGGWGQRGAVVRALDGISFSLEAGETLAVVGESGCGKSTLARLVAMVDTPSAGELRLEGSDVARADAATRRLLRPKVQMVFQNPVASLNPRRRVGALVAEPLAINTGLERQERAARAHAMLQRVGLAALDPSLYPHMLSGGQAQRVAIARALILDPRLLVADEPVSALDVSVQAQVLNLLMDLQEESGVACVFVSHDLGVVRHIAHRVMVMYLGRAVEIGDKREVIERPIHPYTRALLACEPRLEGSVPQVPRGERPSALKPPGGCHFHPRCPHAIALCRDTAPATVQLGGRRVACHRARELA